VCGSASVLIVLPEVMYVSLFAVEVIIELKKCKNISKVSVEMKFCMNSFDWQTFSEGAFILYF
jgi:hypothetical protein